MPEGDLFGFGTTPGHTLSQNNSTYDGAVDIGSMQFQRIAYASVSPSSGSTAGGDDVTITTTYGGAGATSVTLNGEAVTSIDDTAATEIGVTSAPGAAGLGDIVLTSKDGLTSTGTNEWTYVTPITPVSITSVTPDEGSESGSTSISIAGSGFKPGAVEPTVTIDGNACTGETSSGVGGTTTVCNTPAGAVGAQTLRLTNSDGQYDEITFTYTADGGGDTPNGPMQTALKWTEGFERTKGFGRFSRKKPGRFA